MLHNDKLINRLKYSLTSWSFPSRRCTRSTMNCKRTGQIKFCIDWQKTEKWNKYVTLNVLYNIIKQAVVILHSFSHAYIGTVLNQEKHINNTTADRMTYNFLLKGTHKSCMQILDNQQLQFYFIWRSFETLTPSNDSQ